MANTEAAQETSFHLDQYLKTSDTQVPRTLEAFLNKEIDPETTATRIAGIYAPHLSQGNANLTDELWTALVEVAKHSGRDQADSSRVVAFLNSLSEQGDIADAASGTIQPSWATDGVYWRDLPGFAFAFRVQAFGSFGINSG
jgi:hypothetical protein